MASNTEHLKLLIRSSDFELIIDDSMEGLKIAISPQLVGHYAGKLFRLREIEYELFEGEKPLHWR